MAGLNALWVAAEYLPPSARVVLIDRNLRCGGMWIETYDFVRLHQPHPYFTVGDIPWDWHMPDQYLASRPEVLSHLDSCLEKLRARVTLTELFGYEVDTVDAADIAKSDDVNLSCRGVGEKTAELTVKASRVIFARGNSVPAARPLSLSSSAVTSITPGAMAHHLKRDRQVPVYIVGGGKTGLDCALQCLSQRPQQPVTLIAGKGTAFFDRSCVAPFGWQRWWKGRLLAKVLRDITLRFNGSNFDDTFAYFKSHYSLSLSGSAEHCFFGYLSQSECAMIESSLKEKIDDYLEDVVDSSDGLSLLFKSGRRKFIPDDAIIVNCTGLLLRERKPSIEHISHGGKVLNISSQGSIHFLSSVSSYFLTHLFFSEKRSRAPVYAIDAQALFAADRRAWFIASAVQAFMNPILLLDAFSVKLFNQCGLNTDRLFPPPRKIAFLADLKFNRHRYLSHSRFVLGEVARRFNVRCSEIDWS